MVDWIGMITLGTWRHVEVNFHGIKQLVDFEVVKVKETFDSFDALLGLRWFVNTKEIMDT